MANPPISTQLYRIPVDAYNLEHSILFSAVPKKNDNEDSYAFSYAFSADSISEKMAKYGLIKNASKQHSVISALFRRAVTDGKYCELTASDRQICNLSEQQYLAIETKVLSKLITRYFSDNNDAWETASLPYMVALSWLVSLRSEGIEVDAIDDCLNRIDLSQLSKSHILAYWINECSQWKEEGLLSPIEFLISSPGGLIKTNIHLFQKVAITALTHHHDRFSPSILVELIKLSDGKKTKQLDDWLFTDQHLKKSNQVFDHIFEAASTSKNSCNYIGGYTDALELGVKKGHPMCFAIL